MSLRKETRATQQIDLGFEEPYTFPPLGGRRKAITLRGEGDHHTHSKYKLFFMAVPPLGGSNTPFGGPASNGWGLPSGSLFMPWTLDARQKTPEPIEGEGCPQAPVFEFWFVFKHLKQQHITSIKQEEFLLFLMWPCIGGITAFL